MTFDTKFDAWIALLVGGSLLMMAGLGLLLWPSDPTTGKIVLGAALFNGLMLALVGLPCRYQVSDEALKVSSGLFIRKTIPLTDIAELVAKRSFVSAPAWSLDRIHILSKQGQLLAVISPKDQEGFLRCIKSAMQE